ncbi:CocE/NonD family hydrolase [Streptomyces sp. HNM0574]|uniref:CocE/NonD family hydrolase n=1 Tax=Streptomyces sp. HNM0574 TaxID=2714954 RepID=UPI00146A3124|nr:CocE/NonD family hydrolase [Streptomyces sp. HNM0574]NLU65995.1 CocE/NonD family hydrolase [Streptomyces sp. HNM0574]
MPSPTPRTFAAPSLRSPRARGAVAGAAAAGLLTTAALAGAPHAEAAPRSAPAAAAGQGQSDDGRVRFVDIAGDGGTALKANVVSPADAKPGERHPAVVLPTSWAMPQVEYLAQAKKLADSGYVVVSYNSRGFWQSGGEIETAGPEDVRDASKVIDWTLAHTSADPDKVGMAGVSYGAGIGLLAAAHDERIKAVVALSGWGDLIESIYGGRTQHKQAAAMLGGAGALTGRPSAELRQILDDFMHSNLDKEDEMIAWGKKRSPSTYVDRINDNGAAVMLGNAWGDSIFPPNQYADLFEKLEGPKRLEFRPGDHATPEMSGLLGLPNDTWSHARSWLDRYLKGERNGIDEEAPVQLKSRSSGGYEGYADWDSLASSREELPLDGEPRTIAADKDSGANGGTIFLSQLLDQFFRLPPTASLPLLPRSRAAVWESAPYERARKVRGAPRLHTTVTPHESSGTGIAYLYDVGPLGHAKLISSAPFTFHDRKPGEPFPVDVELGATAYDVPEGHRTALVVDGVDPLYIDHNPDGARLTFTSPATDPSRLTIPVRD